MPRAEGRPARPPHPPGIDGKPGPLHSHRLHQGRTTSPSPLSLRPTPTPRERDGRWQLSSTFPADAPTPGIVWREKHSPGIEALRYSQPCHRFSVIPFTATNSCPRNNKRLGAEGASGGSCSHAPDTQSARPEARWATPESLLAPQGVRLTFTGLRTGPSTSVPRLPSLGCSPSAPMPRKQTGRLGRRPPSTAAGAGGPGVRRPPACLAWTAPLPRAEGRPARPPHPPAIDGKPGPLHSHRLHQGRTTSPSPLSLRPTPTPRERDGRWQLSSTFPADAPTPGIVWREKHSPGIEALRYSQPCHRFSVIPFTATNSCPRTKRGLTRRGRAVAAAPMLQILRAPGPRPGGLLPNLSSRPRGSV